MMAETKLTIFSGIGKFFRELKGEIKKIVWPAVPAVFKNMGVVLVVILIIGLFVFALDTGLLKLLSFFMNVSK